MQSLHVCSVGLSGFGSLFCACLHECMSGDVTWLVYSSFKNKQTVAPHEHMKDFNCATQALTSTQC